MNVSHFSFALCIPLIITPEPLSSSPFPILSFLSLGLHVTVDERYDSIGHRGKIFIMSYDDERLIMLFPELENHRMKCLGIFGVEVAGGLVGKNQFG